MAEIKKKPEQTVKSELKYNMDTLKTNCFKLFGVSTSTFIGATTSMNSESEYTVKEVDTKIKQWLAKEVKK